MAQTFKILASGASGRRKTTFGLTFPKVFRLGTEPNGLDALISRPDLKPNLVHNEEFIPSVTEDVRVVFNRLEKATKLAHEMGHKGEVETLHLDNLTFLSMNRWIYINKYEAIQGRNDTLDTRGMYGALGSWLYNFVLLNIVSFPGHVVITAHEHEENEQQQGKSSLYSTTPITADILGGFRDRVGGLVSAVIFLEQKRVLINSKPQVNFYARCLESNGKRAKNRYGLPEIVEDISYATLVKACESAQAATITK